MMGSILELPQAIAGLKKEERELFDRLFFVNETTGALVFPEEMKPWVDKTFGSYREIEKQKIVKTFNRISFEGALFNEVRAKRPRVASGTGDAEQAIKESENDNFCKPLTGTPSDTFGRVKGKYCISASNVAKYDALHGLVVFKKHSPLDFAEKEVQDYFSTCTKWLGLAHRKNPTARYPFILWNCLWRSGASIIHGHIQMVLGEGMHYAEAEHFNEIRKGYTARYNSDYFEDIYNAHESIGLGVKRGKNKLFMSITARKEKEITIIGPSLDKSMVSMIYSSLSCLTKDFDVESFNVGIIMQPIEEKKLFKKEGKNNGWAGFPVIVRILDRGKLSSKTTDFAGMEMYAGTRVIEGDPYRVFEKLKERF
jgi:hypothetical protein